MAVPSKLEPLFLLSDEPIGSHEENAFTDDPFARTVARAALGTKGPFTIGVYGGWGSGKTSALHAARTMIDDDPAWSHIVTVEFNAWRYEREEHPIVPLVATIERAVTRKLEDEQALTEKIGAAAVAGFKLFKRSTRALLSMVSGEVGGKAKFPLLGEIDAKVSIDPGKAIEAWTKDDEAAATAEETKWTKASMAALYKSIFDHLDLLGADVQADAAADLSTIPRVVVFIDDLDRCQADKAFELLENVKLVLCQPGFVFVLALNDAVVNAYLSHLAEKRYGKDNAKVHKSYLEKIVQLPLPMPSRSERFTDFATYLLDNRLSKAAGSRLRDGLKKLAKVLALSANRTPRSLVRRINTALIDIALRDPKLLPPSLRKESGAYPIFSGLCIVQRTLEAALGPEMTRTLAEDNALCAVIAKNNIWGINEALKAGPGEKPAEGPEPALPRGAGGREEQATAGWLKVFEAIWSDSANNFLWKEDQDEKGDDIPKTSVLTSPEGRRWLSEHEERRAIMRITVQRPDAEAAEKKDDDGAAASPPPAAVPTTERPSPGAPGRKLPAKQRAIIERAIRQHLKLPADAPLGPAEMACVTKLNLFGDPVTDAGATWLADPATGLKGLTKLFLGGIQVTDAGVKDLARKGTGLKRLTTLGLSGTQVTGAGVKDLARKGTGLKGLTVLVLRGTRVTDAVVKDLAREGTGLKALATLFLSDTEVTVAGVKALVREGTGLKGLTRLYLRGTRVTNAGVQELRAGWPGIDIVR